MTVAGRGDADDVQGSEGWQPAADGTPGGIRDEGDGIWVR